MKKRAHVARDPDMSLPTYVKGTEVKPAPQDRQELDQFHMQLQSKVDTQGELGARFSHETTSREKERALARKLFKQAPVASSAAPTLQPDVLTPPPEEAPSPAGEQAPMKLAAADIISRRLAGSLAPRVDAFLEKNASASRTEAQRRYPELLKVAR